MPLTAIPLVCLSAKFDKQTNRPRGSAGIAEQYNFDKCLSDSQIKLLKTSKYVSDMKKRSKNLKLNGIHFFPIDNESTSDRYYRSGKTHNLYTIQTEKIAKYKELLNV